MQFGGLQYIRCCNSVGYYKAYGLRAWCGIKNNIMNPFDIVVVVIVGFCLIRGLFRGLIKELASIIAVLAGFYAAYTYYPQVAAMLSRWMSDVAYRNILSFTLIFCGIFLVISILGVIIKYLLKIAFLGWVDRFCGMGIGLIKGILIVSILLVMLTAFLPKGTPFLKKSLLAPYVSTVSEEMSKVVSKDMKRNFDDKLKEFKKVWKIPPA
jgi:membrane protein required for colicin V production